MARSTSRSGSGGSRGSGPRKPGGYKGGPRKPGPPSRFGKSTGRPPTGERTPPREGRPPGRFDPKARPNKFNKRAGDDRPRSFKSDGGGSATTSDKPRVFKGPGRAESRDDRPRSGKPASGFKGRAPARGGSGDDRRGGPRSVRPSSDGSRAFKGRSDFRSDGPRERGDGFGERARTAPRTPFKAGSRPPFKAGSRPAGKGAPRPRKGDFPSKTSERREGGSSQHSNERFRPEPSKRVMPPRRTTGTGPKSAPALTTTTPKPGHWLFATRPGAEQDLADELVVRDDNARREKSRAFPSLVVEGLVTVEDFKPIEDRELAFARQGFLVGNVLAPEPSIVALQLLTQMRERTRGELRPWALDVWVPDGEQGNSLHQRAQTLEDEVIANVARLAPDWGAEHRPNGAKAFSEDGLYAQMCMWQPDRVAAGVTYARESISLAPGGRMRMSIPDGAPSRAATKLMEAFVWLRREPDPGDLCVDLGAAPGGWTWVIHNKRAKVLAVDMGKLAPSLRDKKGIYHLEQDAFTFEPEEHVDWLFADLAFRPLDTAGLFCRWARHRWARHLVANIKLPMKQKAHHIERIRDMLLDAGWANLRIRQLYHDREEVTIGATRID